MNAKAHLISLAQRSVGQQFVVPLSTMFFCLPFLPCCVPVLQCIATTFRTPASGSGLLVGAAVFCQPSQRGRKRKKERGGRGCTHSLAHTLSRSLSHTLSPSPTTHVDAETIPRERFDTSLRADMFLMSPPCQPFTRTGRQQGIEDRRSTSLRFILDLITTMQHPPRYIVLENVKGVETSNAREPLIAALNARQYAFQEFILSPDQVSCVCVYACVCACACVCVRVRACVCVRV